MRILAVLLLAALTMVSCGGRTKRSVGLRAVRSADSLAPAGASIKMIVPPASGCVKLEPVNGYVRVNVHKNPDQTIWFEFDAGRADSLHARLTSNDPSANIRFSQILLPNGTMDGPFGREIGYSLAGGGLYRLSVHENMMAGDRWSGVFGIEISLSGTR